MNWLHDHIGDVSVRLADAVSIGVVFATISAVLPPTAAALSILWSLLRLYEMRTGRNPLRRRQKVEPPPE